jgi:nitric oxide dioxygenase
MSNLLHDTLEPGNELDVAFPFGDFVLEPGVGPVVLLSAGVGLTPLLAMLNALVAPEQDAASRRPVSWVQAARAPGALAFREHIARLAGDHPEQLKTALFYSYPEGAPTGEHFVKGRLDLAKLDVSLLHLDDEATEYYVCGPEKFMLDMARQLRERGVSASRIHAEIFGAGSLQL